MKKLFPVIALFISNYSFAQSIPVPSHIVIVMDENRDYYEILGNPRAPYINSLIADTATALFTNSNALVSGSQPNYLMLFSGSTQGVSGSAITTTQFTDCNLGASLIANGKTFIGYSDSLPSVGFLGATSGEYARKHNPWSNWQGTGTNQLPPTTNVPLTYLPADYDSLPTVSFIVPDLLNDMHTPSDTSAIAPGDNWLKANLDSYVQWAKTHNSLFIFTYDESDTTNAEHILTFFTGQYVKGGSYPGYIDNYHILSMIENLYNLPYCANSSADSVITSFWKGVNTGIKENTAMHNDIKIWPVPSSGKVNIDINANTPDNAHLVITDPLGRIVQHEDIIINQGANEYNLNIETRNTGVYYIKISGHSINCSRKVVIEK